MNEYSNRRNMAPSTTVNIIPNPVGYGNTEDYQVLHRTALYVSNFKSIFTSINSKSLS